MSQTIKVKNSDGDFFLAQNYVLQLLAEKKITQTAFILYCFYRSLAGFNEIKCSYEFISINSGISKGSITNGNNSLRESGLIRVTDNGPNKVFEIDLVSGNDLPRRQLKTIEKRQRSEAEHNVQQLNTKKEQRSVTEPIKIENKNSPIKYNTTAARNTLRKVKNVDPYLEFISQFTNTWTSKYSQSIYPKLDYEVVQELDDPEKASKYINTLWSLDEADDWIRNSDHSLTIFVKEYKSGRLQSYYNKTIQSYTDKKKEEDDSRTSDSNNS